MWIILLDTSGSMGKPFRGRTSFEGRSVVAQAEIKLNAARLALLERLPGLGTGPVAILAFTDSARPVFVGAGNDQVGIRTALDQLEPGGETDVAAALTVGLAHTSSLPGLHRFLVVTDGLSDRENARAAAEQVTAAYVVIDIILIDPTDEGEAVAREITGHYGEVQAVTTAAGLDRALDQVAHGQAQLMKEVEEARTATATVALQVQAKRAPEEIQFTAGYPGTVSPEPWYPFVLFIHLDTLADEVQEMLRREQVNRRLAARLRKATGSADLARGTELTITPVAENLEFNPRSVTVTWQEDIQEVPFRFRARSGVSGVQRGRFDIRPAAVPEGLEVASLSFVLRVRGPGEPETTQNDPQSVTGSVIREAFASYSHKDAAVVNAVVSVFQSLGIYVYIDTQSLRGRGGQLWWTVLQEQIRKAEAVLLFWSENARKSGPVQDEWRFALSLADRKGDAFIRPLTWEQPPPEPPPELKHLLFETLNVSSLAGVVDPTSASAPQPSGPINPVPSAPIVPLLAGTRPAEAMRVEDDVRWAIDFLERTTALRYYPVPTLLVDEYVVQRVRRVVTPDSENRTALVARAVALAQALTDGPTELAHRRFTTLRELVQVPHPLWQELKSLPKLALDSMYSELEQKFVQQSLPEHTEMQPVSRRTLERALKDARDKLRVSKDLFDILHAGNDLISWVVIDSLYRAGYSKELIAAGVESARLIAYPGSSTPKWKRLRDQLVAHTKYQKITTAAELCCQFTSDLCEAFRALLPVLAECEWCGQRLRDCAEIDVPNTYRDVVRGQPHQFSVLVGFTKWVTTELECALSKLLGPSPEHSLMLEWTPTYGVYVSAVDADADRDLREWALDRGIPPELTLPGRPRVLLCLDALPRAERILSERGENSTFARVLQKLVLVHEHAHAVFDLGVDVDRSSTRNPGKGATSLNESLAVWMELHAVRGESPSEGWVWEYIRTADYPAWPYAGAERIEEVFQSRGLDGVKELVIALRCDPLSAQKAFDIQFPSVG